MFQPNADIMRILAPSKPWYENEANFEKCMSYAEEIIKQYRNTRIFSLGQSPAWIVKTISLITNTTKDKIETGYIPFSGKFYEELGRGTGRFSFYSDSNVSHYKLNSNQRPQHENHYRQLLTTLELDPLSIIKKAAANQQKTVILEYTQSGESLASFLSVLFLWAKELNYQTLLRDALTIMLLKQNGNALTTLYLPQENISIVCDQIIVESSVIVPLANNTDTGANSDRLVAKHMFEEWDKTPILSMQHAENLAHINEKLTSVINKKYLPVNLVS